MSYLVNGNGAKDGTLPHKSQADSVLYSKVGRHPGRANLRAARRGCVRAGGVYMVVYGRGECIYWRSCTGLSRHILVFMTLAAACGGGWMVCAFIQIRQSFMVHEVHPDHWKTTAISATGEVLYSFIQQVGRCSIKAAENVVRVVSL